jgi:hypothetical protein
MNIEKDAPAGMLAGGMQVRTPALLTQGGACTTVMFDGSVSTMVTPVAAAGPALDTVSWYVCSVAEKTFRLLGFTRVFVIERSAPVGGAGGST